MVLGVDGVDEGVGPAHHLDGAVAFADEGADDLDAVAAHVDDGAAAGLLEVPEPRAVRPRVRLARADPQDIAQGPALHRRDGLQRLRGIDEVFEVAVEDAGLFDEIEHPLRLFGRAPERLRAKHGLAGFGGELHSLLVQMVRHADHDDVRLRVLDRLGHAGRPVRNVVLLGERPRAVFAAGEGDVDAVAAAPAVERRRVEHADKAGAEEGDLVGGEHWIDEVRLPSVDWAQSRHGRTSKASGEGFGGWGLGVGVFTLPTQNAKPEVENPPRRPSRPLAADRATLPALFTLTLSLSPRKRDLRRRGRGNVGRAAVAQKTRRAGPNCRARRGAP